MKTIIAGGTHPDAIEDWRYQYAANKVGPRDSLEWLKEYRHQYLVNGNRSTQSWANSLVRKLSKIDSQISKLERNDLHN